MIEVDAVQPEARARRRTWLVGGVLLLLCALLGLGFSSLNSLLFSVPFNLPLALFGAAVVVFAIGLGRAGSVTARRPLGTGALIALAVWQLVSPLIMLPLPEGGGAQEQFVLMLTIVSTATVLITLVLAVIAVVQIARAGVLPNPWNRAPMWALVVVVATQVLPELVAATGSIIDQAPLVALYDFALLVEMGAVAFLGVLAIVLALRPAPGLTTVYRSGNSDSGVSSAQ